MKVAPLPGSFMLMSILGFLVSAFLLYPVNSALGFASALIFMLMFVAAIISMTYADVDTVLKMDGARLPNPIQESSHKSRRKASASKKKKK